MRISQTSCHRLLAILIAATAGLVAPVFFARPAWAAAQEPCGETAGADTAAEAGMLDGPSKPSPHGRPTTIPSSRGSADSTSAGSSTSGPATPSGDTHKKCPYSTQECLNYMAQRLKTAGWIGIEYDAKQAGFPKVQRVIPGSPAEAAGLQVGDELLSLNGVELKEGNEEKLKAARAEWTPGHTVHYVVKRNGATKPIDIVLGTWPADVLARYIGEHMLEHAEADAQAQAQASPAPKRP